MQLESDEERISRFFRPLGITKRDEDYEIKEKQKRREAEKQRSMRRDKRLQYHMAHAARYNIKTEKEYPIQQ
jgi:hypothetical protein